MAKLAVAPPFGYAAPVRFLPAFLILLLAGCATTPPPPVYRPVLPPTVMPTPSQPEPRRPAWQPRRVVPDGRVVPGGRLHIVKRGETGIAIARAYGVSWRRIVEANKLDGNAPIEIGQRLFIPIPPKATPEQQARDFELDIDDLPSGTTGATRPAPRPAQPRPATPPSARPQPPQAEVAGPRFSWPVEARVIISGFGPKPNGRVNDGINIRSTLGAPVRAAADGTVIYSGEAIAGYGNLLLIRHAGGWVTAYGHLESTLVGRGQAVKRGDLIGRVGASGNVEEPQLHFQTRQGRRPVNPVNLLR